MIGVAARSTIRFLSIALVVVMYLASGTPGVAQVIKTERWCENPVVDAFYYADGHIELDVPVRGEDYRRMQFHPSSAVNPEPTPTPEETARGYITFVPAGRIGVVQVYCPATSEISGTTSIFASPGEFEQATFAIRPLRNLGTVTFTRSDFTGPGGAVIPSSVVDMYIMEPSVEEWSTDPRWVDDCEWVAKWLRAGSTATGNQASNIQVLIDVHVPDDAAPGVYSGTVAIQVSGAPTYYFNVQLEVVQIALERSMPSGLFYYTVALSAPAFREFEMSEMRRTGHTQCVLTPAGGNCGIHVYPDGSLDFTHYDTYVDAYIKAGFKDPPIISLEGQMYNIFAAKGVLGQYPFEGYAEPTFPASSVDAETRAFAGLVLRNIHDHAVSTWGDWYAYFSDEPSSGTQRMEKAKFMCGVAREYVPEMKTAETIYINDWWAELAGMVDLVMKHYVRPVYNATLNEGDHIWSEQMGTSELYGMDWSGYYDRYWDSRITFFMHEKGNMDGLMNWRQNIAMDMAGSAYPWSPYIYLAYTGKGGLLSIVQTDGSVWRCMPNIGEREGIDDTRYVRTLRKAINDAQANGYTDLANAGQAVLDDVLGDVAWYEEVFYVLKPWDAAMADDARRRLADAIVQLTTGHPHVCVNKSAPGTVHDGQSWATAYLAVQQGINAAPGNSEVWVAAGTYVENITLKSGAVVYGGFAGLETERDQRNYNLNVTILDGGSAGRVVSATAGVVTAIDGFTIRNGNAYSGAGVYSYQSSVAIRNNIITGNTAATGPGGGVYCYYGSSRISNSIIAGNSARYGGGMYCYSSSGAVTNNTVVNNTATTAGGGIYLQGSALTASNNIVAFCNSGIYNNAGTPTLRNNCVYGNTSYNYSGLSAGTGDISVDPLLVDRSGGNYHIQPTSPCMNAGYNTADMGTLDVDAQPRVYGAHVDIGADEVPNTRVTYVSKNAPGPAHDGQSWATGYLTVQEGINAAPSRMEVWVAAGTYTELITLRSRVELYGGFAGTETERSQRSIRTNASVLDGGAAGRVVSAPSGVTETAVLDGFTIRNGSAPSGAGIYCYSSSPTIRNNMITGNAAATTGPGGAIWCYAGASPNISNNIIAGNSAKYGGGIYCYNSSPTVTNNTLVGNTATFGGGIYLQGSSPVITNNIISFGSSGVYRTAGGSPVLKKNCVYGNTSSNYSGLSQGVGDISVDPLFVNRSGGNYHIQPTSPCVNAGDNMAVRLAWSDIDGQSRIYGSQVDMGADEVHISVGGRVVLQDYSGDVTAIPVTLELRKHGGGCVNTTLSLDASGNFVLSDVEAGTYDLAFKASHWLRKVVANTVVNSNMPGVNVSLTNGDADGNNYVTPADLSVILSAMDSVPGNTNWDPTADLDGDNEVTSTDLSVALLNMDRMGDI